MCLSRRRKWIKSPETAEEVSEDIASKGYSSSVIGESGADSYLGSRGLFFNSGSMVLVNGNYAKPRDILNGQRLNYAGLFPIRGGARRCDEVLKQFRGVLALVFDK